MNTQRHIACLLVLLSSLPTAARAQTAVPVLDINSGAPAIGASSAPSDLTVVGGKLFFTAEEPSSGRELWVSDGTSAGTEMLADLCPGACSSDLTLRGGLGGVLLFTDGSGRLFRSDGTRAGTFALAERAESVAFFASAAYFPACDGNTCRLWKTNGTLSGTQVAAGLGADPRTSMTFEGFSSGGKIFWVQATAFRGTKLWTVRATQFSANVVTLPQGSRLFASAADRLFFLATNDQGEELWTSDGTEAGTKPLTRFTLSKPFAADLALKAGASGVYFAADDGLRSVEVWKSDGTAAGTARVTALSTAQPFVPQLDPTQLEEVGGRLVVIAFDPAAGYRLYASRGTPASTAPLGPPAVSPYTGLLKVGGRVYFRGDDGAHGYELWATDGTPAGTAMVRDVCPGLCDSQLSRPQAMGSGLVFLASDGAHGPQVWTSDGTAAGTFARTNVPHGALFAPNFELAALGSGLFFTATDDHGEELWMAGGSAGGGHLVQDIAGTGSSSLPRELTKVGDRVVFTACDGTSREVWASDGTLANSIPLTAFHVPQSCIDDPYGTDQQLYLTSDGGAAAFFWHHRQDALWLWRTDGSPAGTYGLAIGGADPSRGLAVHDGTAFFGTGSSDAGELWRSDGTTAGTRKVLDLPAGSGWPYLVWAGEGLYLGTWQGLFRSDGLSASPVLVSSAARFLEPPRFTQASGHLYFFARDAQATIGLWTSDGTAAGTRAVSSPGHLSSLETVRMVDSGGKVYFLAVMYDDSSNPFTEIWTSDGTAGGTVRLARFPLSGFPLSGSYDPGEPVVAAGRLFFIADDGVHGRELWTSDGTAGGTVMVRDLYAGPTSSAPTSLTAFAGKLYFAASDVVHGRELWVSDGSAAGTRLAQDAAPGGLSSSPDDLTPVGDRLFFTADDGIAGRELWVLRSDGAGCQPAPDRLCLSGGRFAVTVAWRDFAGNAGAGQAVPLTADTGAFWFFSPRNLELAIKVLDGRTLNQAFWIFYGALSSVEYEITVTDTQTGLTRRYQNPPGQLASVGDTHGFGPLGAFSTSAPQGSTGPAGAVETPVEPAGCKPGSERLCLNGGRFAVQAAWKNFAGNSGNGIALPLTGDTGAFWFFGPNNLEVFAKVLDGRAVNNKFWLFYAALSSVDYTLTVTDTETGAVRTYHNPPGWLASVADTSAF